MGISILSSGPPSVHFSPVVYNPLFVLFLLLELALDSNPVCQNPFYRQKLLEELGGLRHLDLKRVTEEVGF